MTESKILAPTLDHKILGFLWQWKLLTTAALTYRFFGELKPDSGYRRLKRLERLKLIKMIANENARMFFWTLAPKGFQMIKSYLPTLEQDGFKSENLVHDHLVSCFHLGEWLKAVPEGAKVFSEQQLRRFPPCTYPDWVPRSSSRRPDGYWFVSGRVISLEVELSVKTECEYYSIAKFYEGQTSIQSVYWLVPGVTVAERILKYFRRAEVDGLEKHHFVYQPEFGKLGWGAALHVGAFKGKTVGETFVRNASALHPAPDVGLLLDSRKYVAKSAPCAGTPKTPKPLLTPI